MSTWPNIYFHGTTVALTTITEEKEIK